MWEMLVGRRYRLCSRQTKSQGAQENRGENRHCDVGWRKKGRAGKKEVMMIFIEIEIFRAAKEIVP